DVWSDDFLETSFSVLASHKVNKLVVDFGAMRQEECASGCIFRIPEEQLLVSPNDPVVSLGRLFSLNKEILHLLFFCK
ncbi:MAG: hypothetical protein ACK55Z_18890, partial [bacterium]